MVEAPAYPIGDAHYRDLGLIANPFRVEDHAQGDVALTRLAKHVHAASFLAVLDASAMDAQTRPVWAYKSGLIPAGYHRAAVSESISVMSGVNKLGLLAVYVPFTMMRFGRVRSALSGLAERLSGPGFPYVLGATCLRALEELDDSLPEFAELELIDLSAFISALKEDLGVGAEAIFGPFLDVREGSAALMDVMRDSLKRQESHEVDPEESDDEGETGEEDEPSTSPAEPTAAEVEQLALSNYILAWSKAHISPVVARGLRVYRQGGADSMAQEFKVTRAPRKTLGALARFATGYYHAVVIVYDQLDGWHAVPDDLRIKIVSTLSTLRWTLKGHGILAFAAPHGLVPELEEQFGAAASVEWEGTELLALQKGEAESFPAIARWLIGSCALAGGAKLDPERLIDAAQVECGKDADLTCLIRAAGAMVDGDKAI